MEKKIKYLSYIEKLFDTHRHYDVSRIELLFLCVKKLCPEMVKKPRMWEKMLRKGGLR